MKVRDEALWQEQCAELEADEVGREFRMYLLTWIDEAESIVESGAGPAEAVRRALARAEDDLGPVTTMMLGQMLGVAVIHWVHGEAMYQQLSPIEQRLVQDCLALKVLQLQAEAQQGDTDDDRQRQHPGERTAAAGDHQD